MLVAIHQPQFMPWLGYFDKMDHADGFVLLDTVQYKKNEWQNRNRIKSATGPQWLTVPVRFRFPARLEEVETHDDVNWRRKHLMSLRTNYGQAPFWECCAPELEVLYARAGTRLCDVNRASVDWLRRWLAIDTPLYWASELDVDEEHPTQRLVEICRVLGGTAYLSGADGSNYLELDRFSAAGIGTIFQRYVHPEYLQRFGDFESHLSALDLVLNVGRDSGEVLRSGRRT